MTKYTKQQEDTGNVLVIAEGRGCIAVCADEGHDDYVIARLISGKYKLGENGIEVVE